MSRVRLLSLVGLMLLLGCGGLPSQHNRCADAENPSQEIDECISERVVSAPAAAAVTVADGDENDGP